MKIALLAMASSAVWLTCSTGGNLMAPGGLPHYKNLTQREHVLTNLELAYNQRLVTRFGDLLDDSFTFYFSPGDVGGNIPEQWGGLQELKVVSLLFDPTLDQPTYPTCRSIRVDLKLEEGVDWVEVIPEGFPGEKWYTTRVEYDFKFEMEPDITYIAVPDAQAQFTVRNDGTDDAPEWRLVEWRDLIPGTLAMRSPGVGEGATWGGIKALYR
jgi:hypothetical protein